MLKAGTTARRVVDHRRLSQPPDRPKTWGAANMDINLTAFATFAITSQVILVAFFASRRWARKVADRYGWLAYAFGILGLAVGAWLATDGASWRLFLGPLIFAIWAGYGSWVDLFRRIEWRPRADSITRRPIQWSVLGPYITLYLTAQMFLWWPLWDYWRPGWAVYLVLFIANTALNMAGHFGGGSGATTQTFRRIA